MEHARRVVIVEDNPEYRASLEAFLGHAPGLVLADSFGSAERALAVLAGDPRAKSWDLVLMDLELPGMNGIEAIRRLKRRLPEVLIVVLTVFEEPRTVLEAITAGADGYLLKRSNARELLAQLRAVLEGGAPLTAGVARTILNLLRDGGAERAATPGATAPTRLELTDRELDVLRGLVAGRGYKGTAEILGLSLETVRSHIKAIYRKLQVHSVAEAVALAIRRRLV